jgi:hypothetical protein
MLLRMDNLNSEHIAMLRVMSCILRERQSDPLLSLIRKRQVKKGIEALDSAVDALQTQIQA